jgi:predicted TIM-barrel fold metal-dependent hydrolase
MDSLNISRSILSISSPGTYITPGDNAAARSLTRRCNEFLIDLKRRNPKRFGFYASLPLPDVDGSLEEIDFACNAGCDGFIFLSNFHGVYPGDPGFEPVMAELNKRNAVIFLHPTTPCMICPTHYPPKARQWSPGSAIDNSRNGSEINLATPLEKNYAAPLMEFFFDNARAIVHLFLQGVITRYPNIRWHVAHVGGSLPPLIWRFVSFAKVYPSAFGDEITYDGVLEIIRTRFYFDLAGWSNSGQVDGLLAGARVDKDRLLYGSDYPHTPSKAISNFATEMDQETAKWSKGDRENAMFRNSERLFGISDQK